MGMPEYSHMLRLLALREACRRADAAMESDGDMEATFNSDLTADEELGIKLFDLQVLSNLNAMLDVAEGES